LLNIPVTLRQKRIQCFSWGKRKVREKEHVEDLGVDEVIIQDGAKHPPYFQ